MRQTCREIERQTDRQKGRQTDRGINRQWWRGNGVNTYVTSLLTKRSTCLTCPLMIIGRSEFFCMPFQNLTDPEQQIPGITNKKRGIPHLTCRLPLTLNNLAAPCQPCPTRCINAKLDNRGRERGEKRNRYFYENNLDTLLTCLSSVFLMLPSPPPASLLLLLLLHWTCTSFLVPHSQMLSAPTATTSKGHKGSNSGSHECFFTFVVQTITRLTALPMEMNTTSTKSYQMWVCESRSVGKYRP